MRLSRGRFGPHSAAVESRVRAAEPATVDRVHIAPDVEALPS
jgi:hypothetical protein